MNDPVQQRFAELFGPEFGHGKPFDLNLLRSALEALGSPQLGLPPVIHVAGTNGKGSTIAFMSAMAEAAGLKVHAFTKPHLFQLNERFLVAGEIARDGTLIAAAERVYAAAPTLTQFDAQVAAAFLLFCETPADVALIETGMGGRDDSTNVVQNPVVSVITPIGLDHQAALGATLEEIAEHKAGIMRRTTTTVVAGQSPRVMAVLEAHEHQIEGDLYVQGIHWDAYESGGRLAVQVTDCMMLLPLPKLSGRHQIDNAGLACATLLHWRDDWPADAFGQGVLNAVWPGRLQALTRGAFSAAIRAAGGEVWVDGGHNAHAAEALAHALGAMAKRRGGEATLIVGLRARKDANAFMAAIAPAAKHVIAVPLTDAHVAPDEIAAFARADGADAETAPSLAAAMQSAAQLPAPRVLICGSFLLAAEALALEAGDTRPSEPSATS